MKLTTYTSAFDFLARTEDTFRHAEAANGLIYGLAKMLQAAPDYYGAPPVLATVADGDELIASCLRTPPYALVVQSTRPPDADPRTKTALGLLAEHCRDAGADLSGVNGRSEISARFAALWSDLTGATSTVHRAMRVFQLTAVSWPRLPQGRLRQAITDDISLVADWIRAFHAEALGEDVDKSPVPAAEKARRRIDAGVIQLWETDAPVSMVAGARATPRGRTVSLVYTPPEWRGYGFASAAVATYSDQLLRQGYDFCTLFTDLANPTSNHIYQAIGYRPVCDFTEYQFKGAQNVGTHAD
jgi:predicted GNAT family acetyltransferase